MCASRTTADACCSRFTIKPQSVVLTGESGSARFSLRQNDVLGPARESRTRAHPHGRPRRGLIPRTFHDLNPDAQQDLVEIDEAAVRVAERFFMFTPNERMRVRVRDARAFVKAPSPADRPTTTSCSTPSRGNTSPSICSRGNSSRKCANSRARRRAGGEHLFLIRLYDHETATYKAVFNTRSDAAHLPQQNPRCLRR